MHQTFDCSIPVPEQRLRVAIRIPTRHHGKRHSTGDHKRASKRKRLAAKQRAAASFRAKGRYIAASVAYWSGAAETHP